MMMGDMEIFLFPRIVSAAVELGAFNPRLLQATPIPFEMEEIREHEIRTAAC